MENHINRQDYSLELLDDAIKIAKGNVVNWRAIIGNIDTRIKRLREQKRAQPTIPPELRPEYREEIDLLTLENMQLSEKIEKTKAALDRAKKACADEKNRSKLLLSKIDDLELRLISLLEKQL